jgi:hypothetical protein
LKVVAAPRDPLSYNFLYWVQGGSLRSPHAARPPAGPALLPPSRSSPAGVRAALTAISHLMTEKGHVVAEAVGSKALRGHDHSRQSRSTDLFATVTPDRH